MIATNYSEVRNNLKAYCDKATKDYETALKKWQKEKLESNAQYQKDLEKHIK